MNDKMRQSDVKSVIAVTMGMAVVQIKTGLKNGKDQFRRLKGQKRPRPKRGFGRSRGSEQRPRTNNKITGCFDDSTRESETCTATATTTASPSPLTPSPDPTTVALNTGGDSTTPPLALPEPVTTTSTISTVAEPPKFTIHKRGKTFPLSHKEAQSQTRSTLMAASDSRNFVKIWELELLPDLEKILDDNIKRGYSINVRRGEQAGHRIIEVLASEEVPESVRSLLEQSKDRYLNADGGDMGARTTVRTRVGRVEYLADTNHRNEEEEEVEPTSPRSTQSSENWEPPINTRRYTNPVMGDSVGPPWRDSSATLGPLLQMASKFYRLLNWHTFDDGRGSRCRSCEAPSPPSLDAFHPSLDDSNGQSVSLGRTVAYSGRMHKTTRVSRSLADAFRAAGCHAKEPIRTVTDWVLVETSNAGQPNKVRKTDLPSQERCNSFSREITRTADPRLGGSGISSSNTPQFVYSTGRSSGHSFGQLCETASRHKLPDGTKTRNWCVESALPCQATGEAWGDELGALAWSRGGMGVPGDSGAPVVDQMTNRLLGQIWGRDKYAKTTAAGAPPIAYFTAMSDIFDDVRERMPGAGVPRLPAGDASSSSSTSSSLPLISSPAVPNPLPAVIADRRLTLASIDEDTGEEESQTPQQVPRRSAARMSKRLLGRGNLPGLEPVRRFVLVAHAATF
ncbi:uncharacterized protein GGS25DRAFT_87424 [Hypoxylon fragiforme]|uniref:uncharacterized protein n=1 Tax=Hypoxylon fragiforme TaxID=63214 RepID=UPI0020C6DE25|nr:uncharacterized protein GGS25DRAFT_87424 [Hypoxylon fragiforme]KAI2603292.1 hypothetical protein GGS25DRAFT_87424 [Hypoxylon fragiforme]